MKKPILIWAGTLLLLLFCFLQQAQAQPGDCSTSQPRPIIGDQHPCPGDVIEYYIQEAKANERKYTSYAWDVPRAQAGEPPIGWEILSGANERVVRVRVGRKNGTMKVTVNDPGCGTKVATLPVKPGKSFEAIITGPNTFCQGRTLTFTSAIKKAQGNAQIKKGEFIYNWNVPVGWSITSGQGTDEITVIAGANAGDVSLEVTDNPEVSGNGNNGNGVGGYKQGYCGTAVDGIKVTKDVNCAPLPPECLAPTVSLSGPSEFCNISETATVFRVANQQEGVTYTFTLPEEGFIIDSEKSGNGFIAFRAEISDEDQLAQTYTISVTAKNSCGKTSTSQASFRVTDCGSGTPECTMPKVALTAPDEVCNISDQTYTFQVTNVQEGVTYTFNLPEGFAIVEEGNGFVTVQAIFEELGSQEITVTATNECGTATASATVVVSECEDGNPLPVTLTKFEGSFAKGGVTLVWETATEINNDRFEIERSANGTDFIKIGEVKGGGNSLVTLNYIFTDNQPLAGTMYYRLRQVDFDGAFEYSKVVAIESKAVAVSGSNFRVSLFPNPAVGADVNVRFDELPQNADQIMVRVVDMNGRILHTKTIGAGTVDPNLGLQSIGLRKGVYMISLSTAGQSTMQRLVIQ